MLLKLLGKDVGAEDADFGLFVICLGSVVEFPLSSLRLPLCDGAGVLIRDSSSLAKSASVSLAASLLISAYINIVRTVYSIAKTGDNKP